MQMGSRSFYPQFKRFHTEEWEQYLYLLGWNGLNPSPQIDMKLATEIKDPIHHSAFLCRVLGPSAARCFKEWKACFACQDPKLPIPSRKTHPNFKVDEFLRHLQLIFWYAWLPGRGLSGNEHKLLSRAGRWLFCVLNCMFSSSHCDVEAFDTPVLFAICNHSCNFASLFNK